MSDKVICPIILAAGKSQRFGSDKLLHILSYNGVNKPLILHSLTPWLDAFDHVNVVVRTDNHALIQMLQNRELGSRLTLITAINPARGMSASLVSGIDENKAADGWLVGLSDMPYIQSSVIVKSLEALSAGSEITLPTYNGKRGHPVGFSLRFRTQLLALSGDKGAKDIIASSPDKITLIDSPDEGIWQDIDTRKNLGN
jgi:molybdenum cofactor cytidylyltransferase